jgi:large subunit ribosomal protein L24
MKQAWSTSWKSSTQRRKQRKYRYNAPLHVLGNFMHAHLVKDLREKYQTRSLRIRVGDKVKILRGQFKKKEGKISRVNVKNSKVFVEGIERDKGDGSKSFYPMNPSNVMILEITEDKKRMKRIQLAKSTKITQDKQTKKEIPNVEQKKENVPKKPEEKLEKKNEGEKQ